MSAYEQDLSDEDAAYARWMDEQAKQACHDAEQDYQNWLADSDDHDSDTLASRTAYEYHLEGLIYQHELRDEDGLWRSGC